MFASQLLRILQTIPSDVKYEICVFDSFEQDMTMMEDDNRDSKVFGRDIDGPLSFGSKELYHLNGSERETGTLSFEVNVGDERWNPFAEDFSLSNEMKTRDSTINVIQMDDKEPSRRVEELSGSNQTETNLYTDKNVLDCELPEFIVCYKEINYHIVKDICVDDGVNSKDKISIESSKDDESDVSSPQIKEDESQPESSLDRDVRDSLDSEDSKEESSFVDKKLPFQEFGTRSFLRSFISSLNREESEASKLSDQIPSSTEAEANNDLQANTLLYNSEVQRGSITFNFNSPAQDLASVSTLKSEQEKEETVDLQDHTSANKQVNDEQVNLQSHMSANEQVNEESVDLGDHESANKQVNEESVDVQDDKIANDDNISVLGATPTISEKNSTRNSLEDYLNTNNDGSQVLEHPVIHEDVSSDDISANGIDKEPKIPIHEKRNLGESLQFDHGETSFSAAGGAGLITYSGPIAYSGSLSIRSDGSTASNRSFAFPILQNEWNSSPVRMAKADRKQLRKQKCWRSGLLCFRFSN